MNIAQIAPPWLAVPPKTYGGTQSVLFPLIEEQMAQGHDVTSFVPGDVRTSVRLIFILPKALVQEVSPWTMHLKAFSHRQKAMEEVQKHPFATVHAHLYLFPPTVPHVTRLHSHIPFDRTPGSQVGEADQYAMDPPLVPIVALRQCAQACERLPLNVVGVVPNGVDLHQYHLFRRKRGDPFVRPEHFIPEQGTHLALEAAKKANVPITLARTIDRALPESKNAFHHDIEPLIDRGQARYISPVTMKPKRRLLSRARGFLNPIAWEEPSGMLMIEAMTSGCPASSFVRGAAPEIAAHGKTSFPVRNVDEMVEAVFRSDEIDGAPAHLHMKQHFSVPFIAKNYFYIYKIIAARRSLAQAGRNTLCP
ncbi:MAG TPA: glycosyltransferase [Ktedonobacteraceae bacterium]|jgi:glycosyltransferase involved in cell wall biosynthesis